MTRHDIFLKRPASTIGEKWRDSTPLGSGLTGVNLYGGISRETFVINRYDMWVQGTQKPVPPDTGACIEKMRALARENRYEEASLVLYQELERQGYHAPSSHMRALGHVGMYFECEGVFSKYTRTLHMDRGEAEITYKLDGIAHRRRVIASRTCDMVVSCMEFGIPTAFVVNAGFYESFEDGREDYVRESDRRYAQTDVINDCYVYSSRSDDGLYFGIAVRVKSESPSELSKDGISVLKTKKATVYIKAFSSEKSREQGIKRATAFLQKNDQEYDVLCAMHVRQHKKLYSSADIKLYHSRVFHSNEELLMQAHDKECSAELLDKLWHFGRYLFISGTHEKGEPFPLYGLWVSGHDRTWSQHVANENVEMIYWHAMVGGLIELVRPLIHYYYNKMDEFKKVASQIYGCRGIFVSVYTTRRTSWPFRHTILLHFIGTAGWLCRHFYEYYLATRDENLFEEEILPFMLETAAFYEDYLYEDSEGKLEIYPSVSPENTPLEYHNFDPGNGMHPMPVTKNATIEFAILKELLTNLTEVAEGRNELKDRAAVWQNMLKKIPDYRINEDGAIAEWMDESVHDYYFHRHLSHIYPIFPGTEIDDQGKEELIPYFEKAVDLRKLGSMTGWSLAHMSGIYARLGREQKAFDCVNMLAKVCLLDNFFTLHNDFRFMGITTDRMGDERFAPVQLDASMGIVNAMQEWILRVTGKKLYILPACPVQLENGKAKDLRFFNGTITMRWNLKEQSCFLKITADRDMEVVLVLPFGAGQRELKLSKGEEFRLDLRGKEEN